MQEKYLPIGTIVILKGGKKRVMITGFCILTKQRKELFDYSGCLYPEGIISSNQTLVFDHNQIEKIYFVGYSDEEEKQFKQNLINNINKLNEKEIEELN